VAPTPSRSNPPHPTAAPPEIDRADLARGAERLGLALTDEQIEALCRFSALLLRWNRVHNLTAIAAGESFLTHHLLDALSLVRPLRAVLDSRGARATPPMVLDVGAGGGLPGLALAIACPDLSVTLVDAVQKKVAFITQAIVELRLTNATARHARVERLSGQFDVITSRAFAALGDFVRWTAHLRAPAGCWLAMKARLDPAELSALPPHTVLRAALPVAVPGLNEERHLLWIEPDADASSQ
jgi:16S rRNA (guanine527-N7)-methyltransferase